MSKVIVSVSIDAILDTRLATIFKRDATLVKEILDAGYTERKTDNWNDLLPIRDFSWYEDNYANRSMDTLRDAKTGESCTVMTNILPWLSSELLTQIKLNASCIPGREQLELEVNLYPYKFEPNDIDYLLEGLRMSMPSPLVITCVNNPLSFYSPKRLKADYGMLVMYNTDEWLTMHYSELMNFPIPGVKVVGPALYTKPRVSDEEKMAINHPILENDFLLIHATLADIVEFVLIDPAFFSIVGGTA